MKSKCSFTLKALTALVLAVVMLFGTVATTFAVTVKDDLADTGAKADLAETGALAKDIADTSAEAEIVDEGAAVELADTGDDVPYLRYMKDMPSGYYDGNTSSKMTQSSNNSNKWYTVLTLTANSSYGFFIRMNDSDTSCWKTGNTTVESGQEVELVSYGGTHGNSSNRVTYSTGSATSYVFTYDTSNHKISVAPTTTSTVKMAWSIASGHDGDYNLGTYSNMTHSSNGVYYFDTTSNLSTSKYYMFIQTNSNRYHKSTDTLTENTGVATVYDYGTNNYGDSGNKINFTPSAATKYRFTFDIKDKTVKMLRLYTVSYNKGNNPTGVNSISGTAPTAQTKVYGTSLTLATNAFTVSQGYTQDGWTTTNGGTTKSYNSGATYTTNAATTLYPYWKETTSVVTFQRKLGDAAATQLTTKNSGIKTAATYTASAVDGYTFAGWSTTSDLTDTTNTVYAATATLNDPSVTAISVNAKTAITLVANYTENKSGISLDSYTNGDLSLAGGTLTIDGVSGNAQNTIQVGIATKVTAVSAPGSGYSFLGWTKEGADASHVGLYTNSGCTTAYTGGATGTIYIKTDGTLGASPDVTIKAHFQSSTAHYVSVYNNTMYDRGHWVIVSSPPQQVKVTSPVGTTKTYKYAAGTLAQRGEDTDHGATDLSNTANKNIVNTDGATYYEGNLLEVHEGDTVQLIYSALASSDIFTGVFYNNTIRYTTEKEDDNLYFHRTYREGGYGDEEHGYVGLPTTDDVPDDDVDFDYHDDTTHASASETGGYALYANQYYYNTELAAVIADQNYTATVDQDTHTVTWTVGNQNYLNVDMELASKKAIHFSDTVNTVINEEHTDNYYSIGEEVSAGTTAATSLSIKAKGSSTQVNTITKENVKFYYCNNLGQYINPVNGKVVSKANRVEITSEADATLSVKGDATVASTASDSTTFIYIDGTMPATDVMVDLDMEITYSLVMKSKIQYDGVNSKTAFLQVADLTLGTTTKTKNDSYTTSTTVTTSAATCTSGNSITFKADNITAGYMFVGWFLDKNGSPDLTSEPLSRNATFSYKPSASVTVWAVGTRNLYMNGSRYLFPAKLKDGTTDRTDWDNENYEMKYDPERQLYYHEIDETIFQAASRALTTRENTNDWVGGNDNTGTGGNNYGYKESGGKYYWMSRADSEHGNAYFQIINSPTGHSDNTQKTVWGGVYSFKTTANGITIGKAQRRGEDDNNENNRRNGQGFLNFSEATFDGYSTPLRIYFNPSNSALTAEATPIYPHIYVSNGYKGIDQATPSDVYIKVNDGTARRNNITNENSYTYNLKFNGTGWNPTYEGHVSDISVKARNATLTLTKTTANANYKVSNFVVYNMTQGTVKAYAAAATANTNEYSCNTIKTSDADRLYIVPIVEYTGDDKMTILVDSTQLDYKKWGKLVSCYTWGSTDAPCGSYPGQLMVPSDDGGSWKATFKKPSDLTGILFANYVDSGNNNGYTFISMSGIMGTVTYSGTGDDANNERTVTIAHSDYVTQYNYIASGDYHKYDMANCKVQTYDYREPIAYYNNSLSSGASSTTLTFSLKDGNSNLLSRSHAELIDTNILTLKQISTGSDRGWSKLRWEYLTDSTGNYYADLNGYKLAEKPTASFYIAAKGMVKYDSNSMNTVFKTGSTYDTGITGVEYKDYYGYESGTNNLAMKYAVQWYVYDASGNYITNVLSAGFADKTITGTSDANLSSAMSVITRRLLDMGYAVEGRSVKICYDKPRFCYYDKAGTGVGINSGDSFNVYRFTGQWYQDSEYTTAKVYAKVGIQTDNGVDVAEASTAAYGSATVKLTNSRCTIPGYDGTGTEGDVDYAYTTATDGDKGAITLTASDTNFIGWYHYVIKSIDDDGNIEQELVFDTDNLSITPTYSKDSTYIALYEAKVNYRYKYIGREGGEKYYSVGSDTHLTAAEIGAGNKVATDSSHTTEAGTKSPGTAGIGVFKKTVTFNGTVTTGMLTNPLEYVLDVDNSSIAPQSFIITAKYRNANGQLADYATGSIAYNSPVNLSNITVNGTTYDRLTSLWTEHTFIGWYEYVNDSTVGQLLSTQANYGMVATKTQTIVAVYEGDTFNQTALTAGWYAYVDDNEVNYEMTSATTGDIYNDAIVRVRYYDSNTPTLDENGKVGMIIVEDNGSDKTIDTSKLSAYAAALNTNGKTGNVSVTGSTLKVTNLFTSAANVNNFGRADFAAKYSFASASGHKYYIYPYYYDGTAYHFNTTPTSGTYR